MLLRLLSIFHIRWGTNCSSWDSTALLILADASNAYPVIVKNITSSSGQHQITTLSEKEYKYKNCCAAYSPLADSAVIITRSGTIKLVNCSTGLKNWTVLEVGEQLDISGRQWRHCSVGFSRDGYRALILDRKGKLFLLEFESIRIPIWVQFNMLGNYYIQTSIINYIYFNNEIILMI